MSEDKVIKYEDGVELVIDRRGSKICIAQRVWHTQIDGTEEPEEWHICDGTLTVPST